MFKYKARRAALRTLLLGERLIEGRPRGPPENWCFEARGRIPLFDTDGFRELYDKIDEEIKKDRPQEIVLHISRSEGTGGDTDSYQYRFRTLTRVEKRRSEAPGLPINEIF